MTTVTPRDLADARDLFVLFRQALRSDDAKVTSDLLAELADDNVPNRGAALQHRSLTVLTEIEVRERRLATLERQLQAVETKLERTRAAATREAAHRRAGRTNPSPTRRPT